MTTDKSGQAFPRSAEQYDGMTLRMWLAGQALSAMRFSIGDSAIIPAPSKVVEWAFCVADAMLADAETVG
jgi:hypothetical protein